MQIKRTKKVEKLLNKLLQKGLIGDIIILKDGRYYNKISDKPMSFKKAFQIIYMNTLNVPLEYEERNELDRLYVQSIANKELCLK